MGKKINEPTPRYMTQQVREILVLRFGWTYFEWMQDWPLEIIDEVEIDKCIEEYKGLIDEDVKFGLMHAILYRLDEIEDWQQFARYSDEVSKLLKQDFKLHEYTIYYWTLYGNKWMEGQFRITPLMRRIWDNN